MDGALALLGLGLMCFGGVLVAEGIRRSAMARWRARMPGTGNQPRHQDSGYRHTGTRGKIEDVGESVRARVDDIRERHVSPGAPFIGAGLFIIGAGLILIAQVLGR